MSAFCKELHEICSEIKDEYKYNYESFLKNKSKIPESGIYIVFEDGQKAHHNKNRIVRIGTHTGKNNLKKRLSEHFEKENKDRSIFRKNIGRAFLNKDEDNYLETWNIDFTTKKNKEEFGEQRDKKREEKEIEPLVSARIRKYFSFIVLPIEDGSQLYLEAKIISTVSCCKECGPQSKNWSGEWFGKNSPEEKIRCSGLWQKQHLWGEQLTKADMKKIRKAAEKINKKPY
jgi:Fe-S cluster assembly iron-binding protein IscA